MINELRRRQRHSDVCSAIDVTGGTIFTSWIPRAGAIVEWDCMFIPIPDSVDKTATRYFRTTPEADHLYRTFMSNSGSGGSDDETMVNCWFEYQYGHGAGQPWRGHDLLLNTRITYIWDSLNGKAGYITKTGEEYFSDVYNKKTQTSGLPLELFCGRMFQRMIIYKVKLINQNGSNMTLIPAIKDGEVGFDVIETGDFLTSDNEIPFTIFE